MSEAISDASALSQARQQLNELAEAARTGALIPIRLPGQIEAIVNLLDQAEEEAKQAAPPAGVDGDFVTDTAEFYKVAIHELRTPMTSIRGYGDMLGNPGMAGELNEMQNQLLAVIRSNSRRMESLLTDVSTMNKLRAGVLPVNIKMDMFKNISMMLEKQATPLAEELKREISFDIPDGLPILNTDGELLAQALYKLIENALRYSPEGTGKVTVSAENADGTLIVKIADNGIGMTPEEIARVDEVYYRADSDEVRAYKGSGLGGPIAYGIIKLLGGEISAESTPGEGTTFSVKLKGLS